MRRKLKALNAEVDAKERRATDVEQRQLKLQQDLNALDAERLEIEKRQQGTVALQEKQKELGRIHSSVDFKRFRIRFWLYFIKFSLIHSFPV